MALSPEDYETLESFIGVVLRRVANNETTVSSAAEDLLHPLTAWDRDGHAAQEFIPWIKATLEKWVNDDA